MYSSDISGPSRLPMSPLPDPPGPPALSPPQQQQLAERYAPILYFDPRERNFLQDPNTYIDQSSLRKERDYWPDKELYDLGDIPARKLADIGPGNRKADDPKFLDHREEELGRKIRAGDLGNSKNLYQYDAESNTITYHLFYAYNDGAPTSRMGEAQNHEGDWEKVTIQLDDRLQPTAVRYSAHSKSSVERSWADAQTEDGRLVVYVNKGSHANSPEPGRWATDFGPVVDESKTGGVRFDLAGQPAVDITQQEWYGGNVQWGERNGLVQLNADWDFTSGPTGPGPDKGPILKADPTRRAVEEYPKEEQKFPFFGPNGLFREHGDTPQFPLVGPNGSHFGETTSFFGPNGLLRQGNDLPQHPYVEVNQPPPKKS